MPSFGLGALMPKKIPLRSYHMVSAGFAKTRVRDEVKITHVLYRSLEQIIGCDTVPMHPAGVDRGSPDRFLKKNCEMRGSTLQHESPEESTFRQDIRSASSTLGLVKHRSGARSVATIS